MGDQFLAVGQIEFEYVRTSVGIGVDGPSKFTVLEPDSIGPSSSTTVPTAVSTTVVITPVTKESL